MLDQLLAHNMLVMNQGLFQDSSIRASGSGV
jgi:hypothetical protein